ncbi:MULTISPECIES: hypothetical protein [Pseudomonas]|uniref:hypothetical protein n=1 Tax=Pseudomonas TaxID=286 RepID=UPI00058F0B60|nr:hypothetical protein [Pseudomonas massiliensis]
MKIDPTISAKLASLRPNHIGMLAWSLLANPAAFQAGGVPGQPDPDTPNQPTEPGEPTIPDQPPPTPMA